MADNLVTIPIDRIFPNPNQPRKEFDPEKLEELAMSIGEYGVRQPILVTPRPAPVSSLDPVPSSASVSAPAFDSNLAPRTSHLEPVLYYMIIAGERRYRASLLAGQTTMPAVVTEADDALVEELALLENIQRQDLNIIEEARGFRALLDRGWTREDLARKMGFKQPWRIDMRISLLNLNQEYQTMAMQGKLNHNEAYEMSRVPPEKQSIILRRILAGELPTFNKLRAFVNALIELEQQESIFAFETITDAEQKSIGEFEAIVRSVERFMSVMDRTRETHLKKTAFHSSITPERLDLIIQHLMKLRRIVHAGSGIKTAAREAVA